MTREQARELLPIIKAFSEGKAIEWYNKTYGKWIEARSFSFEGDVQDYRIKSEPKYRPFKDVKECWNEMFKHQPFGWIKCKVTGDRYMIDCLEGCFSVFCNSRDNNKTLKGFFTDYTFADDSVFGVKED